LQGVTALAFVREAYRVKRDDVVLVHAAAGGVGSWMCQVLKAVGAKTIGTAGTKEKCELAAKNGAAYVVNNRSEDVVARVMEITGGVGVVAVFDGVGKATFDQSFGALKRHGTFVSFGSVSGAVPEEKLA
jgi:NADPH2:quinone reductase